MPNILLVIYFSGVGGGGGGRGGNVNCPPPPRNRLNCTRLRLVQLAVACAIIPHKCRAAQSKFLPQIAPEAVSEHENTQNISGGGGGGHAPRPP